MWLRDEPMRRHHFLHARKSINAATAPAVFAEFERRAAALALELGLCDPDGAGSLTHPSLERTVYGDGKVVTPLYKAKPGQQKVDKATGEVRTLRADPDAKPHVTGGGEPAYGNKFVILGVRSPEVHGRVILGIDHVAATGGEAAVAVGMFRRVVPGLPGTQAALYDGALRGTHLQTLLHEVGVLPVVPVHAASGGRRSGKPRVERAVRIGQVKGRQLYAEAGGPCMGEPNEDGDIVLTPLVRRQIVRRPNADGTWRWYGEYDVPPSSGGGTIRLRLDRSGEDERTGFNRTENLRAIPPADPDFKRLYPRRADSESINRGLDDLALPRPRPLGGAGPSAARPAGLRRHGQRPRRSRPAQRLAAKAA